METPSLLLESKDDIPSIFFDGFELQLNNAAIRVVLKLGNNPLTMLRFSYVTGKTLLNGMAKIFAALEEVMGRQELDSDQMNVILQKVTEKIIAEKTPGVEGGIE